MSLRTIVVNMIEIYKNVNNKKCVFVYNYNNNKLFLNMWLQIIG